MRGRKVTKVVAGHPIKTCYRCGKETPHSLDGILCVSCGLTTYNERDNEANYQRYAVKSDKLRKEKQ